MLTDVGKSESYQKLNGAATMQSKSKLFSHNLDRVIIPMLACDHGLFEHAPVPLEEFSFDLTGNDERVLLTKVDMDNLDAYANFEDGEEHPQEEDEIEDGD